MRVLPEWVCTGGAMGVVGALTCGTNGSLTTKCFARTVGASGVCATAATAAFTGPALISGMNRSRGGVRSTLCGSFGPVVVATATAGVAAGTAVDRRRRGDTCGAARG